MTEARVEPKLITLGRRFREFKAAPGLSKLDLGCASEVWVIDGLVVWFVEDFHFNIDLRVVGFSCSGIGGKGGGEGGRRTGGERRTGYGVS